MYDFMHAYTNDCLVVGSLGFSQALWMPYCMDDRPKAPKDYCSRV